MKIRTRLIITFLIMTLFPLCAGAVCFHGAIRMQTDTLVAEYSTNPKNYENYEFLLNPVSVLYNITLEDYKAIVKIADQNPDKLLNYNELEVISNTLSQRESYIILRRNDTDYYIGDEAVYGQSLPLPYFTEYKEGTNDSVSLDQTNSLLIRQKDFYFSDNTTGQIFLITDLSKLIPHWKNSIHDIVISFLLIIIITSIILILWIYHSIVRPLSILRIATRQIGAGNLDEPVHIISSDEIGELCRDFEEMRIRLKSILEERIQYEQNTREMMSNISHDLKTPLTAIKGYAEGLIDGVAKTPAKQEKYLKIISSKAADMTYLVDELSLFSKIEQNALPYNFVTINISEYFEDCISDITLDLEANNNIIKINYENSTEPEAAVIADAEQLKRVIYNITSNAAKYMDKEQGVIKISITNITPKPAAAPLYL